MTQHEGWFSRTNKLCNLVNLKSVTYGDGYGLLNGRIMLDGIRFGHSGTLNLALWGRNLLDEEYPLSAIDNLPHADRAVTWGDPRSIGLDVTYHYD